MLCVTVWQYSSPLPLDSLALIHIYAVLLSLRLQGQKCLSSSTMIACARALHTCYNALYFKSKSSHRAPLATYHSQTHA